VGCRKRALMKSPVMGAGREAICEWIIILLITFPSLERNTTLQVNNQGRLGSRDGKFEHNIFVRMDLV
jgi:hypothetical protein